jgi:hypothetical protein
MEPATTACSRRVRRANLLEGRRHNVSDGLCGVRYPQMVMSCQCLRPADIKPAEDIEGIPKPTERTESLPVPLVLDAASFSTYRPSP